MAHTGRVTLDIYLTHARSGRVMAPRAPIATSTRARLFVPTWFCTVTTERWTAWKALRRCIEHCREHTWVMERTLQALG